MCVILESMLCYFNLLVQPILETILIICHVCVQLNLFLCVPFQKYLLRSCLPRLICTLHFFTKHTVYRCYSKGLCNISPLPQCLY